MRNVLAIMIKNARLKNFADANAAMPRTWPSNKAKHCVTAGSCVVSHPSLLQIQGVEMQTWRCTVWWISRGSNHDISKSEKPPEVSGELLF